MTYPQVHAYRPRCPVCASSPEMTPETHTRDVTLFICRGCSSTLAVPTDRRQSRTADDARREAANLVRAVINDGRLDAAAGVRDVVEQAVMNDLLLLPVVSPVGP